MYKVYADNQLVYSPEIDELALINPVVDLEENKAGSFSFSISPEHPFYDALIERNTVLTVYQDDEIVFRGRIIEITTDFYKIKDVYCEGELTYLNDSVQRPARYQNMNVRTLLEAYIAKHNEQVEDSKRFTVGVVTVTSTETVYRFTNMESTMQCLQDDFIDNFGGFFRVRYADNVRYLDYLIDSQNVNSQIIKLGKNLLDYSSNLNTSDIATAIIPLGERLAESEIEGLETRLDIKSVNDGKDYVFNQDAVDAYGWIYKVVEWDDVTNANILKTKGLNYLNDEQYDNVVIEASAVDLNLTDGNIERFKLSDSIRVVSTPHGMDKRFRLTKQTLNLTNPELDKIQLGKAFQMTLASTAAKIKTEMETQTNSILESATANATALITAAMGGYVYKTNNELYIMDTNNPETAEKVWRWNINGLGYSSTGIDGPYGLAMTMDGSIIADFITAGKLTGIEINNGNGTFKVDENGTLTANSLNSNNANITGGSLILNADNAYSDSRVEVVYGNSKARMGAGWFDVTSDNGTSGINIQQNRIVGYKWTSPDMMDETFWINSDGKSSILSSGCMDAGNGSKTTFAYSKAGLTSSQFSWIAVWNGYELRAVNQANLQTWLGVSPTSVISSKTNGSSSGGGYCVVGYNKSNQYTLKWTGSSLQFFVDTTNVGSVSDIRLKKDITAISDELIAKIDEIEIKQFKVDNRGGLISVGVIAQDIVKAFEEVGENVLDYEIIQEIQYRIDDETLYYSIDYPQYLILKAKAQDNKIKDLQKQIDDLKELTRR